MAQQLNLVVNSAPILTTGTSAFTLGQFDVASLAAIIGGLMTVGGIKIRASVTSYEEGGGTYTVGYELVGVFRVAGGNPSFINAIVAGNEQADGQVGSAAIDTITYDASGTLCRLRCTPQSGTRTWVTSLQVQVDIP